jgi:hypothetical protein
MWRPCGDHVETMWRPCGDHVEHLAEPRESRLVVCRVPAGAARRERTEGGHRGALQRHPAARFVGDTGVSSGVESWR